MQAEPAQTVGVAPVRDRRGHLEQREVADDRAAQPPVQPEHRHEVDGRERDGRDVVDVGAVAAVEAERVHRAGEQRARGCARGVAAAVLVGLDLDHRRLRAAAQARQRPRVRVGLLELVGRAVDDELEELLERAVALEVPRERRRVVGRLDRAQREVDRARPPARDRDVAPQRGLELAAPARRARRAATGPTPSGRRRPAGRGSAARSRGRARAGGPRRRPAAGAGASDATGPGARRAAARSTARGAWQGDHARLPYAPAESDRRARPTSPWSPRSAAISRWRRRRRPAGVGTPRPRRAGDALARRAPLAGLRGRSSSPSSPCRQAAQRFWSIRHDSAGGSRSPASWRVGEPRDERDHARDRRGLGDRRLRVRHADLERAVAPGAGAAPTTTGAGRRSRTSAAPRRRPRSSAKRGRHALAREQAGDPRADRRQPAVARPRRTARWRPARRGRAGASAGRCRRPARGRRRGWRRGRAGRRRAGGGRRPRTRRRSPRSAGRR